MKVILVATDGSRSADDAVDFAVSLAKESNASLHVLAVRPTLGSTRGGAVGVLEIEEAAGPERIAARAARRAEEAGLATTVHVVGGDPAETIVATADHEHADLIVVGSRGLVVRHRIDVVLCGDASPCLSRVVDVV